MKYRLYQLTFDHVVMDERLWIHTCKYHILLFSLYQVTDEDLKGGRADRNFFAYHASTARSPVFINSREVTGRYTLDPGSYLIIPTTFEPNHTGEFIVRIYSEKPVKTGYVALCFVLTNVLFAFLL